MNRYIIKLKIRNKNDLFYELVYWVIRIFYNLIICFLCDKLWMIFLVLLVVFWFCYVSYGFFNNDK